MKMNACFHLNARDQPQSNSPKKGLFQPAATRREGLSSFSRLKLYAA